MRWSKQDVRRGCLQSGAGGHENVHLLYWALRTGQGIAAGELAEYRHGMPQARYE